MQMSNDAVASRGLSGGDGGAHGSEGTFQNRLCTHGRRYGNANRPQLESKALEILSGS